MIKTADHVIDLGPGGGVNGGKIVITGTPEQIAACSDSFTGQYLKPLLARRTKAAKVQVFNDDKVVPERETVRGTV